LVKIRPIFVKESQKNWSRDNKPTRQIPGLEVLATEMTMEIRAGNFDNFVKNFGQNLAIFRKS
jgi:hypothetical protein